MATMATTYSILTLIFCLLTGGGNELLDYLPSEAYWKHKQVDVSVEAMVKQLAQAEERDVAALVVDLGSPDAATRDEAAVKIREAGPGALPQVREAADSPDAEVRRRARTLARQLGADAMEQGVRRLMAIRTLGELGKPEGVAALKPLLASKELFVAEYAQGAIDAIEGKGQPAKAGDAARPAVDDVWLLPAECRAVGQLVPRGGPPLAAAVLSTGGKEDVEDRAGQLTRTVLALAEQIGNVRIDAVTFGLAGNPMAPEPGQKPGSVTVIVRGLYNAEWARALARAEGVSLRDVDGTAVFEPDGEQAWLMPSDELFVLVASPEPDALPLAEIVAAVKAGEGSLAGVAALQKLIGAVDTKQALWAAALVTPDQRELPVAGGFDAITLVGAREGDKTLRLTIHGRGGDADRAKEAAELVNAHAKESADFLQGMQVDPIVTLAMELLKTVKAEADGSSAVVTAHLDAPPAAILSLPILTDGEYRREKEETSRRPRPRPEGLKQPE